MNEVLKQLSERKSVRAFTDRKLSEEDRNAILTAAVQAPTAGNQQLYTILDIQDQKLKDRLAETCDHQPMIAKADMVLIFCADAAKWLNVYRTAGCQPRKPGVGDLLLACSDACIAAQNAVTAAWSLGIGSCYIGDIMENAETHQQLLHLPEYVMPACMIIFGHPAKEVENRIKPERCDMDLIVQKDGYHELSLDDQKRMVSKSLNGKDFESWTQAFCARKYNSDFAREMSRSVEVYLDQFK